MKMCTTWDSVLGRCRREFVVDKNGRWASASVAKGCMFKSSNRKLFLSLSQTLNRYLNHPELMSKLNPNLKNVELMPQLNPNLKHVELMPQLNPKHLEM